MLYNNSIVEHMQHHPESQSFTDQLGRAFGEKPDGYVDFGDIARELLGRQCQYASYYIEGYNVRYPALGRGLRFSGLDTGSYHDIGVHPEDVEELVHRFAAYDAFSQGYVYDNDGNPVMLSETDREVLKNYLVSGGAFSDPDQLH